jgi:catalase-peroxidase
LNLLIVYGVLIKFMTSGCNGARIRLSPQTTWPENADLDKAINLLEPIHEQYKSQNLSWGDLIVLAGNAALEDAAAGANVAISIPFVGGRVDAPTDEIPYPDYVDMPLEGGNSQNDTSDAMKDAFVAMGLTNREAVALVAAGHSLGSMHRNRSQFADGSWTTTPGVLNTEFLENLLTLKWEIMNEGTDMIEYQAQKSNMTLYMLRTDINIAVDDEYEAIAQEYLISPEVFYEEFVNAWAKITSADMMFYSVTTDGQDSSDDVPSDSGETGLSQQAIWVITVLVSSVVGGIVIASLAYLYMVKVKGYHFTDKAAFEPLLNDYN